MSEGNGQSDEFFFHALGARIDVDELTLDPAAIARGLGYRAAAAANQPGTGAPESPPITPHVAKLVDRLLERSRELLAPEWTWIASPIELDARRNTVICPAPLAGTLAVGKLVRSQLAGAEAIAAFVATIGPKLEAESRRLLGKGQPLEGFVLDTIGSIAAEATADRLQEHVSQSVASRGWKTTNRFSPGYCTWMTEDQHALFALLPPNPAGVVLSESSLMKPLKSVSGIIGLGPAVRFEPYPCEFCSMTACRQRLTEARF